MLARSGSRRVFSPAAQRAREGRMDSGVQAAAHVGEHVTKQDYRQFQLHQLEIAQEADQACTSSVTPPCWPLRDEQSCTLTPPSQPQHATCASTLMKTRIHLPVSKNFDRTFPAPTCKFSAPAAASFVADRTPRPYSFTTQTTMSHFQVLFPCRVCDAMVKMILSLVLRDHESYELYGS